MDPDEELITRNPRSASILSPSQLNFARGSFNSSNKFYKSQSKCSLCEKPFSKSPESLLKRHCCQFCFNAFCNSCSPLTYLSVLTNSQERCCITCFVSHTKEDCEKSAESKYRKTLDDETEIRLSESHLRKTIEVKHKELEDQLIEKDLERSQELVRLNSELEGLRKELEEVQREKAEVEKAWKEDKENNENTNEEVIRLNNEVEKVRKELQDVKKEKNEIEKSWKEEKKNSEEVGKLRSENEELKKKVQGLMRDTKASSCGCCIV